MPLAVVAVAPDLRAMKSERYDVLVAGARCAGASTAMLLARAGLNVLVVDPQPRGRDTLSTHAVMRGGVLQLHRWGLLTAVRTAGTPPIRSTTFHYADEAIEIPIKPADGVDALYAPRRTVLDPILVDAALSAGAAVEHGVYVTDLLRDADGRVRGAVLSDASRKQRSIVADVVIGADGVRSRVARQVGAQITRATDHSASSIYGYWRGLPNDGNHWYYDVGQSVGTIPTNEDETCIFALVRQEIFHATRGDGLESLHRETLERISPDLAEAVAAGEPSGKLRGFAGIPGFLRRSAGPGWALVGDAGYFKDPITAHGITDALRDAELLALAILEGREEALRTYEATRNQLADSLLDITDRIASFEWDLETIKDYHVTLSRQMKAEVEHIRSLDHGVEARSDEGAVEDQRT